MVLCHENAQKIEGNTKFRCQSQKSGFNNTIAADFAIGMITSVLYLYTISMTLLSVTLSKLKSYSSFLNNAVVIGHLSSIHVVN